MPTVKSLWEVGRTHLEAARLLAREEQHDDSGYLAAPVYLLLGFALELLLKAWLMQAGTDERGLRRLGHDLTAAYDAAVELGFKTELPIGDAAGGLRAAHIAHAFRYMEDVVYELPKAGPLIDVLLKWDDELQDQLKLD